MAPEQIQLSLLKILNYFTINHFVINHFAINHFTKVKK